MSESRPRGRHWLGRGPGAESRVGGTRLASPVVSQTLLPFAKHSATAGRMFAQLSPCSDPELSWFLFCTDSHPAARCPAWHTWNGLVTLQKTEGREASRSPFWIVTGCLPREKSPQEHGFLSLQQQDWPLTSSLPGDGSGYLAWLGLSFHIVK